MVDIVAHKMPSENDVHVARSFLTKILRSSMRRNEPISRPHSWHSAKFNDSQSEAGKAQRPPAAIWHARHEASSSTADLSGSWELTNLCRVSDQFSSLGSMDSLEHVSHTYPANSSNSTEHLGGKRDSAYSSFSTSSSTPDYSTSKSSAVPTESALYKVSHWDTGGKRRNGPGPGAEGVRPDDRPAYFQMPGVGWGQDGPHAEDPAGCRHSASSRTSFGPVWNVPEKKNPTSPSPPPPAPPARSDSFAATRVHERGLVTARPEGPDPHSARTAPAEARRSHSTSPKTDGHSLYVSPDQVGQAQFGSDKQPPLSSTDTRHVPQLSQPLHQRHHSDRSPSYPQPWTSSAAKPQHVAGYHSNPQEPPANGAAHPHNQNQRRTLSASPSLAPTEQNAEGGGHSRYYCVTTRQTGPPSSSGTPQDRKSMSGGDLAGPQTAAKPKYPPPPQQQLSPHSKDATAHSKLHTATAPENPAAKAGSERGGHKGDGTQTAEPQYLSNPPNRQSLPPHLREVPPDIRHSPQAGGTVCPQAGGIICPQATPMLHSLSMDAAGLAESLDSKQMMRSSRFATTLRNEIQMRRAKLQKSKSAAALPGAEYETEDVGHVWKSAESSPPTSADGSFSSTYKDHLKEAQARVLKATSFRRKDLEPVLLEHPPAEAPPGYQCSAHALPTVTESAASNAGPSSSQVARVGGRKRFPAEKKVRSFSEPDKIHHVGVHDDAALTEKASCSRDQQQPRFPNHTTLHDYITIQGHDPESSSTQEDAAKGTGGGQHAEEGPSAPRSAQFVQDQQRLGTFAEYEARWNIQRKAPEKKASGRYRSADNILDPGSEDRAKSSCFHERSRSSPSADIYGQKLPVSARRSDTAYSQTESNAAHRLGAHTGFSDSVPGDCIAREKPAEFENDSAIPAPPTTGANPDCRQRAAPATVIHKPKSFSQSLTEPTSSQAVDHSQPPSGPRWKPSVLEKPPPTRCQEVDSQQSLASSQREAFGQCSPKIEPKSAFHPTHSGKGDSEQGKGLVDKGQGAVHHLPASNPQPASSPPASSYRPSGLSGMEGQRSPSPQFSPQRLSDKPPVSHQDEESTRLERVTENQNTAARKVPIRIVHSEGNTEKENSPFLQQNELPPIEAEGRGLTRLGSLGAAGQSSVFCAFTRQKEPDNISDTQTQEMSERDAFVITAADESSRGSPQSTGEPSSNRAAVTTEEEQKREELARDIMGKDKSLADILDQSKMKTTMDLMEGIFPEGEQLLEGAHQRRKVQPKHAASRPVEDREKEDSVAVAVSMVTSSTYYSTSAPKAELLIKMKDMQEQNEEEDSEDELDIDLANKKQELIDSLSKKLQVLREARESLQEDILDNNALGDEVEARVQQVCKPNELDKFRMFVGDLDKVVSLLLSLSGRLARVENALNSLEEDATPEERRTLIEKRKLLIRQHEDAKELKENLDRRERLVYDILANYLPEDSLTDYEHFVKMKSALIIEQRKLEDKVKLGEEQLKCLMDSLPIEQRLAL